MIGGLFIMGGLGALVGVGLAVASKVFYVYIDPKIEAVDEALPGANCGGCGYPGCSANAAAIVAGESSPSSCVAGGPDVALEIAEIMGVKIEAREPDIAAPGCRYGVQDADVRYLYEGINDCRAAMLLDGGAKLCPIGCLGLGTCVSACPFGALSMGKDNLPVVNPDLCTGCGTCERVCPKHIITLSSNSRRFNHEYTTDECSAPCQRACPAGIDIPAYIKKISEGKYLEAVQVIKESNPFPLVCGRICVQPCELECRRNLVDKPVAINNLKRFAADYAMKSGQRVQVPRAPETGKRLAVIGGGAEGLTAAYFLNRLGHDSTVYEATSEPGGILRTGIPENRLPRDVLDWEINDITDAGVKIITSRRLGKDYSIESLLKEGFSAVFVATGGWDTQLAEKDRDRSLRPLPGVQLLIDFILDRRDGKGETPGESVMIIGGGNAALEAARTTIKEGAKNVYMVFRTPRDDAPISDGEIRKAEEEGIRFCFQSAVTKMTGEGNRLTNVEISAISTDGKVEGDPELIPIDILLTGTGRFPELIYVPCRENDEDETLQEPVQWETFNPYAGPFAEQDIGIFRPGEVMSDYKAVVEAIGAGRRGAASVQQFLTGMSVEAPENMIRRHTRVLSLDKLEPVSELPRQEMPQLSHEEQLNDPCLEIATGYSEEQALKESKRCLQCGLICYRRVDEGEMH